MKKNIIFTLFLISLAAISFAQFELKPAIGLNVSKYDSDPSFKNIPDSLVGDRRMGYQLGASLAIGRKLYVEPGVFYNKMSQSFTPTYSEKEKFNFSTSYIRIPVNLGVILFGDSKSLASFRIYVGPSLFIPLSVKDNSYPLTKDNIKSPLIDLSAGGGLNIWLLFLDVSYGWGLTPMFKDDSIQAKMQSFYANIGFRFKFGNADEVEEY